MRASGQVDGSITCDPDNVGASSVEVVFPLAGLSSHVADFDEHLRSACFFDTGNFPHTTFKSTSVRRQASTRLPRSSASTSRSEEHTSELQSLMRISYAVFCLKKKKKKNK